ISSFEYSHRSHFVPRCAMSLILRARSVTTLSRGRAPVYLIPVLCLFAHALLQVFAFLLAIMGVLQTIHGVSMRCEIAKQGKPQNALPLLMRSKAGRL